MSESKIVQGGIAPMTGFINLAQTLGSLGNYVEMAEPVGAAVEPLKFEDLRQGNIKRLPQFKNRKGELAHTEADGSDWSLSDWGVAMTGEVGELCSIIKSVRRGDYALDDIVTDNHGDKLTVRQMCGKELGDIITYADITALQLGIDLGDAVRAKFNEISDRVKVDVKI